jgi:hypothetical protein
VFVLQMTVCINTIELDTFLVEPSAYSKLQSVLKFTFLTTFVCTTSYRFFLSYIDVTVSSYCGHSLGTEDDMQQLILSAYRAHIASLLRNALLVKSIEMFGSM